MAARSRWSNQDHDEHPEYANLGPGDPVILPQPRSHQLQHGADVVLPGGSSAPAVSPPIDEDQGPEDEPPEVTPERQFFVRITTTKTLPPIASHGGRILKNAPKQPATTREAGRFAVLSLDRKSLLDVIFANLAGLGGQQQYAAGITGPPFKVWYTSSAGGKSGAPTISTDGEWMIIRDRLCQTPSRVVDLNISIDITDSLLESYRMNTAPLATPNSSFSALPLQPPPSTQVPSITSFSEHDHQKAAMAQFIKEAHPICDDPKHAAADWCHISDQGHFISSRLRQGQLTEYLLADPSRRVADPLPDVLVEAWKRRPLRGETGAAPRGRTGPHPASSPAADHHSSGSTDFSSAFAQGLGMVAGFMASSKPGNSSSLSSPSPATTTTALRRKRSDSLDIRSSSPPIPDDEMDTCMDRFAKRRGVAPFALSRAKDGLKEGRYFPADLTDLSVESISEITGLTGGDAIGLINHAAAYSVKIAGKRARRHQD